MLIPAEYIFIKPKPMGKVRGEGQHGSSWEKGIQQPTFLQAFYPWLEPELALFLSHCHPAVTDQCVKYCKESQRRDTPVSYY